MYLNPPGWGVFDKGEEGVDDSHRLPLLPCPRSILHRQIKNRHKRAASRTFPFGTRVVDVVCYYLVLPRFFSSLLSLFTIRMYLTLLSAAPEHRFILHPFD
jgi:hypothetical protein